MLRFMRDGGVPIWFVLVSGGSALVAALLFACCPDERRLGLVRGLTIATIFGMLAGFLAGVALSLAGCGGLPESLRSQWPMFFIKGLSEAMTILILGCALLGLAWMITSVGLRRWEERGSG